MLHGLVTAGSNIAIIANAGDYRDDPSRRKEWVSQQSQEFASLGYEAEELDLRDYFSPNDQRLREKLSSYAMVWLTGGNVFLLRKAMKQSGFDKIITQMVRSNEIVYGGFSAGACVAAPTLHGIDKCDDPNITAKQYDSGVIWEGLGFIPYSIVPHFESNHPESHLMTDVIAELEKESLPYRTLHDGEVIIVNN